jgi:ribosomal 50S subunit-recycling heat shock protein
VRLDLYLKTCRLVKRRTLARELCEAGRVLVNDHEAKPAKDVKPGDRITLLFNAKSIELEVLVLPSGKPLHKAGAQDLYRVLAETKREQEDRTWIQNPSLS